MKARTYVGKNKRKYSGLWMINKWITKITDTLLERAFLFCYFFLCCHLLSRLVSPLFSLLRVSFEDSSPRSPHFSPSPPVFSIFIPLFTPLITSFQEINRFLTIRGLVEAIVFFGILLILVIVGLSFTRIIHFQPSFHKWSVFLEVIWDNIL